MDEVRPLPSGAHADPAVPATAGEPDSGTGRVSRRQLIRQAGIGGGVVLASSVLASPALANPALPNPSRTGRTPESSAELATKAFVEQERDSRVARAGDTMQGALLFDGVEEELRRVGTGVGVAGPLDFALVTGGQVRLLIAGTGEVTVPGPVTLDDSLTVSGAASLVGPVEIDPEGQTPFGLSALTVGGPAEFASSVEVAGQANFADRVYVSHTPTAADVLSDPDVSQLAANKQYVDAQVAGSRGVGARGGRDPVTGEFDEVFFENDISITRSYTIGTRYDPVTGDLVRDESGEPLVLQKNALSAGPVEILPEVEVTVPDGSVWTIV